MTSQFRNILDQEHILKELAREKSIYRITILKKADPKLIIAICEIIYNILEGNLPLDKKQKELLFKERNFLKFGNNKHVFESKFKVSPKYKWLKI